MRSAPLDSYGLNVAKRGQFTPIPDFDSVPHRMKLSIPSSSTQWGKGQRNKWLAVWCECMAQINQQARDPEAKVDWKFWGWDYLAVIPIDQPAGPIFRKHVAEYDARRLGRAVS